MRATLTTWPSVYEWSSANAVTLVQASAVSATNVAMRIEIFMGCLFVWRFGGRAYPSVDGAMLRALQCTRVANARSFVQSPVVVAGLARLRRTRTAHVC